jgi:hypothetical protein
MKILDGTFADGDLIEGDYQGGEMVFTKTGSQAEAA